MNNQPRKGVRRSTPNRLPIEEAMRRACPCCSPGPSTNPDAETTRLQNEEEAPPDSGTPSGPPLFAPGGSRDRLQGTQ